MTIERMFNNGMLTRGSVLYIFDEGTMLYEGTLGAAPLDLISREIVDVNIRYKERRPVELIVRLSHEIERKLTVRRLSQTVMYPETHITLVKKGVTVYVGYYYDLPRCYLASEVKSYRWIVGEFNEIVVEI